MQALEEQIEEKLSRVLQEIELGEISCMESAVRMALYRTAVGSALWSLEEMEACQEREKESCLKRFLVWKIFSHPECTPERAERYLWDTSSQVRRMAVEYRYERLKSGWPGLDRMLLDKSRGVREYVVYILEKHGGPDYMEEHLLEDIGAQEVADAVYLSPFYFQKCFKIITGYSIGEYLRNRRLYLAGLEVLKSNTSGNEARGGGKEKVIDLAYKYQYDTPESFTRAFTRFHGVSPMQLRTQPHQIKVFLPLTVEISVKGGSRMEYRIEKREAMKMIGFERVFSYENSYQEIPKFWQEFCGKYCGQDAAGEPTEEGIRQVIAECAVGEFGVCVEDEGDAEHFRYYIAGAYQGGEVPEGMKVFEIPASEWAKFRCTGAMPNALQTVNTRIFREWLPGNREYELAFHVNIEWYSGSDTDSENYESAIWIPVKRLG